MCWVMCWEISGYVVFEIIFKKYVFMFVVWLRGCLICMRGSIGDGWSFFLFVV